MTRAPARDGKLQPTSVRLTPNARARLERAASKNGLPLTQELERRIEQSFEWERAFGDYESYWELVKKQAELFADAERQGRIIAGEVKVHGTDPPLWGVPTDQRRSSFVELQGSEAVVLPQALVDAIAIAVEKAVEMALAGKKR